MFYLGGLTLGYLTPSVPALKKRGVETDKSALRGKAGERKDAADDDQIADYEKAMLWPWHTFY